jgi:hypothetical protein
MRTASATFCIIHDLLGIDAMGGKKEDTMNAASSTVPPTAGIRDGPYRIGSTMKPAIAYANRMSPFQMRTRWAAPMSMRNASRRTSNEVRD